MMQHCSIYFMLRRIHKTLFYHSFPFFAFILSALKWSNLIFLFISFISANMKCVNRNVIIKRTSLFKKPEFSLFLIFYYYSTGSFTLWMLLGEMYEILYTVIFPNLNSLKLKLELDIIKQKIHKKNNFRLLLLFKLIFKSLIFS